MQLKNTTVFQIYSPNCVGPVFKGGFQINAKTSKANKTADEGHSIARSLPKPFYAGWTVCLRPQ